MLDQPGAESVNGNWLRDTDRASSVHRRQSVEQCDVAKIEGRGGAGKASVGGRGGEMSDGSIDKAVNPLHLSLKRSLKICVSVTTVQL